MSQEDTTLYGSRRQRRAARRREALRLNLTRWGSIGFMSGGVVSLIIASVLLGLIAVGPFAIRLLFPVVLLLIAVGMIGLHALQKESYGRIGRVAIYTVLLALAFQASLLCITLFGGEVSALLSAVGVWGSIIGFALYGAATFRARMLPYWYGLLLIVFQPLVGVFGNLANAWLGLVLLILGYTLWLESRALRS